MCEGSRCLMIQRNGDQIHRPRDATPDPQRNSMAQLGTHEHSDVRLTRTETNTISDTILDLLGRSSRYIAMLAAWIATCGSLFFSEVLGWLPCVLCWYQRILMYPLALIIAVGILRRDERWYWYVLPFSTLGAGVSLYHYLLVKTDWLPPPPCVDGIPCTVEYLNVFGFINIPFLALTAFLIISFMAVASALNTTADADTDCVGAKDQIDLPAARRRMGAPLAVFSIITAVIAAFVVAARFV
jgi:disulfide bond formation protein DsbB